MVREDGGSIGDPVRFHLHRFETWAISFTPLCLLGRDTGGGGYNVIKDKRQYSGTEACCC